MFKTKLYRSLHRKKKYISTAVELWMQIEISHEHKKIYERHRDMALNKYAVTANLIHPQYRARGLTKQHHKLVTQFLVQIIFKTSGAQ